MSAETEHAPIVSDNGMPVVDVQSQERKGHRVYIGNLSYSATEEQVRELLAPVGGEIVDLVLPTRGQGKRPGGFAIAGYKEEDQAKKAVESLNDKEHDGRKLRVQLARSEEESAAARKARDERREAAKATKKLEEKEKALEQGEPIPAGAAKPKKKRAPRNRRRAPGEEEDAEEGAETTDAAATDGEKPKRKPRQKKAQEARIDGAADEATEGAEKKKPRERKPREPRGPRLEATGEMSKTTIYVSNLPFNVDDDALAAIFTNLSIGVKSAKVVKGLRSGREGKRFRASKGFGFVEVENPSQQQEAVDKVEGSLIGDRKIGARVAKEMKPVEVEAAEAEAAAAQAVA